jgi:hypothetical protein
VVFKQRTAITHLLQLRLRILPSNLIFGEFLVALVDAPVRGLERQCGNNARACERKTCSETGRVFGRFFGEVDLWGVG